MKMSTTMRSDCLKQSTDISSSREAWKVARVSPIKKVESPVESDHYRPIAILPATKVYEKLVLSHLLEYVDQKRVLHETTSRYRKGRSTTSVLLRIRDDTIRAMKNGELTLIAFADFSKAFDTVDYSIFIRKLHVIGLSKAALLWFLSYLTNRRQFVLANVLKGVPQGSILGLVLFNRYGTDIQDCLEDGSLAFISLTTQRCCITPLPNETSKSV